MKKSPVRFHSLKESVLRIENPKHLLLLAVLLYTGARVSEIVDLKKEDVASWGDRGVLPKLKARKKSKREFPIYPDFRIIVDKVLPLMPDGYLFISDKMKSGSGHITRQGVDKIIKKYFPDYSAHTFRKTIGNQIYKKAGNDIALSCAFLGHSNPSSTFHYLCVDEQRMSKIEL